MPAWRVFVRSKPQTEAGPSFRQCVLEVWGCPVARPSSVVVQTGVAAAARSPTLAVVVAAVMSTPTGGRSCLPQLTGKAFMPATLTRTHNKLARLCLVKARSLVVLGGLASRLLGLLSLAGLVRVPPWLGLQRLVVLWAHACK